jgi:uncharacterized protein YbaR (Trm112 family)
LQECGFSPERRLTVSHFRAGVLKRRVPLEILVSLDALAQQTGDWWQLSPSVFVRARAVGGSPTAGQEGLFRCPTCGFGPLEDVLPLVTCPSCGTQYPIIDGIFDFRMQ